MDSSVLAGYCGCWVGFSEVYSCIGLLILIMLVIWISRSTTGYVFTIAGGPVSWRSTLQSTVALSTIEAEYMAMTEAIKEAIWLQGLLDDLGVDQDHLSVHCDSMSAIFLAKNQVHHSRTKHIDVRYHFVREIIEEGDILLEKIDTKRILLTCSPRLYLGSSSIIV